MIHLSAEDLPYFLKVEEQSVELVLGCDARKPVFGVSGKMRFKPACLATETS